MEREHQISDDVRGRRSRRSGGADVRRGAGALAFLATVGTTITILGGSVASAGQGAWLPTDPPAPEKTRPAAVLLDDGRVLVTGGNSGEQPTKQTELYDPDAEGPKWSADEDMHYARDSHTAVKFADGRVLVAGGAFPPKNPQPEIYDPNASEGERWTTTPPIPMPGEELCNRVPDGGEAPDGATCGELTEDPSFSVNSLTVLDGPQCDDEAAPDWCDTVLAVRGGSGTTHAAVFDPETGEWSLTAPPRAVYQTKAMARLDGGACEDGDAPEWCGTVLAIRDNAAEIYDPTAGGADLPGAWKPTEGLSSPRRRHSLVTLANGNVLALGGVDDNFEVVAPAELYRPREDATPDGEWIPPQEGAWTETAALGRARYQHTATLLPDVNGDGNRKVLIVGGTDGSRTANNEKCGIPLVELFDPSADSGNGSFVDGPSMVQDRFMHTATRMADGRVLSVGGEGTNCGWGSAEVYHPVAPAQLQPDVDVLAPDSGLVDGGATVTIRGDHFIGVEEVMFGDKEASEPIVQNQQEITAEAPERDAGIVEVRVKTEGGGWSTPEDADPSERDPDAAFRYVGYAGVWTDSGDLAHTPDGAGVQAVTLGNAGVLGVYRDTSSTPRAVRYDPLADSLEPATNPPVNPVIVAPLPGSRALAVGDQDRAAVYDPQTDEWERTSPLAFDIGGTGLASELVDGRVLVASNFSSEGRRSQVYDPDSDNWQETSGHPDDHRFDDATMTRIGDGRVVLAGGGGNGVSRHDNVQLFDPEDGTWTSPDEVKLGAKRSHHAAVRLGGGRLLLSGGRGVGGPPGSEIFDGEGDNGGPGVWEPQEPMVYRRRDHALAGLTDGSALGVGGKGMGDHPETDPDEFGRVEVFRPRASVWQWQPTGSLRDARRDTGTARLTDGCATRCGQVLAIGGRGVTSVERYVPRPRIERVEPEQAPPGDEVTITGFDLAGADEVTVGGELAEFSVEAPASGPDSPGRVTATVPERSDGPAPVTVTTEVVTSDGPPALPSNEEAFAVGPALSDGSDGGDEGGSGGSEDSKEGSDGFDPVGQVDDLTARALSDNEIRLEWSAEADGGGGVADRYVVAQSRAPIDDVDDFEDALALCDGVCSDFDPPPDNVGDAMTLTVTGLSPQTTYHYAVAAIDADGERGPISASVAVTTGGDVATQAPDDSPGGAGAEGSDAASPGGSVVRVAGGDRITTALAASQEVFEDGQARAAVLARADDFADGLAGVPLAAAENGPLLLTGSDRLDERVATELARVVGNGARVFLLGGEAALSTEVEQQVAELGFEPVRLGGADRFATAAAIADEGLDAPGRVLFATGGEFADAVTAGAAAARADAAVLLTAGDRLPQATADYLARHQPDERYAVGGPAADAVDRAEVLAGATRYETAAAVADAFFPEPATVGLATGVRFPDALSGGAHIARYGGPMLLSGPDRLHPAAVHYLSDRAATIGTGVLYGGAAALGQPVADEASAAITTDS